MMPLELRSSHVIEKCSNTSLLLLYIRGPLVLHGSIKILLNEEGETTCTCGGGDLMFKVKN